MLRPGELWRLVGVAQLFPLRNVALASNGSKAEGVKGVTAEDFPMAYSAALTIDGDEGAQWYIGNPAELVITLPRVEKISRLGYRSAKGRILRDNSQGATPTEYEMLVSLAAVVDGVRLIDAITLP